MKKAFHLLAVLLVLAALGCSESSPEAPAEDRAHPASWADPGLAGAPAFHASRVEAAGTGECRQCHGMDFRGTTDIPGCYACHFGPLGLFAPAGAGWTHGLDLHQNYPAFEATCNRCHNLDRGFGLPPAACHDCHGTGLNHPLGQPWLDRTSPGFHGLGPDPATCSACHDINTHCSQCHFGPTGTMVPPGTNWTHGQGQHENYPAYEITCNRCHDLNRSFGLAPPACHDCHGPGP